MSMQNKPPRLEQGAAATKDRLQKKKKKGGGKTDGKIGSKFPHAETNTFICPPKTAQPQGNVTESLKGSFSHILNMCIFLELQGGRISQFGYRP